MAALISLVFKKLILAIVKVNNSYKINKTVSCLTKTQPEPFLSNGILMILCVNVPIFCAYSIIRHALHLFCFTTKHAIVRNFQKRPFLIAFFVLIDSVGLSGNLERYPWQPHLEVKTIYYPPFSFVFHTCRTAKCSIFKPAIFYEDFNKMNKY